MSESPRITFMHVPKTAGNAILDALKSQFDAHEIAPFLYEGKVTLEGLDAYKFIAGHMGFSLAQSFRAPVITVLRDPVERTLSLYYFWRHNKQFSEFRDLSLEDFLKSDHPAVVANVENTQTKQLAHSLLARELRWARLSEDALLDLAKQNLEKIAVVGLTERLDNFATRVSARFALKLPALQKINETRVRPRAADISEEGRALIMEKTKLDRLLYSHVVSLAAG